MVSFYQLPTINARNSLEQCKEIEVNDMILIFFVFSPAIVISFSGMLIVTGHLIAFEIIKLNKEHVYIINQHVTKP
jgi:hypothetical protein